MLVGPPLNHHLFVPLQPMTNNISYGHIWKLAYPILVSVLMNQLLGMTDTAFLGRYEDGEIALGASALGGLFYTAVFMLGMGLATGTQILMGRCNGEGRHEEVGRIFYHTLVILLLFALVLTGCIYFFAARVLPLWVESAALVDACCQYLHWRLPGFFFAYVAVLFRAYYVATTRTKMLTFNSLLMVVSNVVFNYLLIFGHCGFPRMGIAGAALATVVCEGLSMLYYIYYTVRHTDYARYALNHVPTLRLATFRRILNLSVWTMVHNALSFATWFVFFLAVEQLGVFELAVTNIVRNVSSIFFIAISALAATTSTLTSNLIGRGALDAVPLVLRRTITMAYCLVVPMLLFAALFPDVVLRIYTPNADCIAAGRASLYVLLTSYLLTVPGHILLSGVMGSGNTRKAFHIGLIAMAGYMLYVLLAIMPGHVSLPLCWLSEHIYSLTTLALSGLYFASGRWQQMRL